MHIYNKQKRKCAHACNAQTDVCTYIHTPLLNSYLCMYLCMNQCTHVCTCVCMHVCMYACMHVCMHKIYPLEIRFHVIMGTWKGCNQQQPLVAMRHALALLFELFAACYWDSVSICQITASTLLPAAALSQEPRTPQLVNHQQTKQTTRDTCPAHVCLRRVLNGRPCLIKAE